MERGAWGILIDWFTIVYTRGDRRRNRSERSSRRGDDRPVYTAYKLIESNRLELRIGVHMR